MLDTILLNYVFDIIVLFKMTLLQSKCDQVDSYLAMNKQHFSDPFTPDSAAYFFN